MISFQQVVVVPPFPSPLLKGPLRSHAKLLRAIRGGLFQGEAREGIKKFPPKKNRGDNPGNFNLELSSKPYSVYKYATYKHGDVCLLCSLAGSLVRAFVSIPDIDLAHSGGGGGGDVVLVDLVLHAHVVGGGGEEMKST